MLVVCFFNVFDEMLCSKGMFFFSKLMCVVRVVWESKSDYCCKCYSGYVFLKGN